MKHLEVLDNILPRELTAFYDSFKGVFDGAFGFTLDPFYEDTIQHFESCFLKLKEQFGVSITPKVHIMITHVPEFISRTGKPLGLFSEQVVENAHSSFDKVFDFYRVKDVDCEKYSKNLLRAVLHYNGYHI